MTGLALFILLLAFFIVMNGVSGFSESKVAPVMSSIRIALGVAPEILERGAMPMPSADGGGSSQGAGMSLKATAGVFNAEVPGIRAVYTGKTGELAMIMGVSTFNQLLGLEGTEVNRRLQELLAAIAEHEGYRLEIALQRPDGIPSGDSARAMDGYLKVWQDRLQTLGIPASRLGLGYDVGRGGRVRLTVETEGAQEP